ncbi:MAG: hypothetical protein ACE15D_18785 [Candidatus Eisenbacteria bacterium]
MARTEASRIMYEIYREPGYDQRYRVVYFTELNDHNRESEINRAMAGVHVHDGFIDEDRRDEAKTVIASFLDRWNGGEPVAVTELESALDGAGGLR